MATFSSPREYENHLRRKANRVQRSLKVNEKRDVDMMQSLAQYYVSGRMTASAQRFFGHPFARSYRSREKNLKNTIFAVHDQKFGSITEIGKTVRQLTLPINQQTGELKRSLRVFKRQVGGTFAFYIQFTSPHAIVLRPGGTRYMIDREFWKTLNAKYKDITESWNVAALRRAERSE